MTTAQVGRELGVSAATVRRHWPDWFKARGFPRPLFEDGLLRWDSVAVLEWKRRTSQSEQAASLEPDWAAIARARGLALDAGIDPELVRV
jgi:hypothetical protein